MSDSSTLVAYLVPKLTRQVENAATDALGYILNRSAGARDALDSLLREGGFDIEPIVRVETQVTYEDGSRPDMAGYDEHGVKRLLVEAKFWATLLRGQASGYLEQFDEPGPAVLLFIAPDVRIETLWAEIVRQVAQGAEGRTLESVAASPSLRSAMVSGADRRLMLVSWIRLLDDMTASASEASVKADLHQLRGLAQEQDAEAFLPVHAEDLSPDLGRRMLGYNKLVDDLVDARGVKEGWMTVRGLRATAQRYGYGRYFRFSGVAGDLWLGVNHEKWAKSGGTPLWLSASGHDQATMDAIGKALNGQAQDGWVPIHLRRGVEYEEVLDDVELQVKTVARIVGAHLPKD